LTVAQWPRHGSIADARPLYAPQTRVGRPSCPELVEGSKGAAHPGSNNQRQMPKRPAIAIPKEKLVFLHIE